MAILLSLLFYCNVTYHMSMPSFDWGSLYSGIFSGLMTLCAAMIAACYAVKTVNQTIFNTNEQANQDRAMQITPILCYQISNKGLLQIYNASPNGAALNVSVSYAMDIPYVDIIGQEKPFIPHSNFAEFSLYNIESSNYIPVIIQYQDIRGTLYRQIIIIERTSIAPSGMIVMITGKANIRREMIAITLEAMVQYYSSNRIFEDFEYRNASYLTTVLR